MGGKESLEKKDKLGYTPLQVSSIWMELLHSRGLCSQKSLLCNTCAILMFTQALALCIPEYLSVIATNQSSQIRTVILIFCGISEITTLVRE